MNEQYQVEIEEQAQKLFKALDERRLRQVIDSLTVCTNHLSLINDNLRQALPDCLIGDIIGLPDGLVFSRLYELERCLKEKGGIKCDQ